MVHPTAIPRPLIQLRLSIVRPGQQRSQMAHVCKVDPVAIPIALLKFTQVMPKQRALSMGTKIQAVILRLITYQSASKRAFFRTHKTRHMAGFFMP
jgi:hypothetical protein